MTNDVADVLWSAVIEDVPALNRSIGFRRVWQSMVYQRLVAKCRQHVRAHASPEPFLTLRCAAEAVSGDGWARDKRRYEGLVGGAETEQEYQALLAGLIRSPVVFVAGYPRSGTTSLQTVVRAAFRRHIPEIDTPHQRMSLWAFPKHTSAAALALSALDPAAVRVICAVRPFLDSAASLVVGRGGRHLVDVSKELRLWEEWLPVYSAPGVVVLPFEYLRRTTPCDVAERISVELSLEPDAPISPEATYASLMMAFGKGDPDSPRQSNLPAPARARALADARSWVVAHLGADEVTRLDAIYSAIPFSIDPAGTDEPR